MHWNDKRNPLRVHARERGLSGSIEIDDDDDNNSEDHDDGYNEDNDEDGYNDDGDYDDGEENDHDDVHTNVYHTVDKLFKSN